MSKFCFRLLIVLTVGVFSAAFMHPYYVSVSEITCDDKKGEVQISIKMFTDNLEEAIGKLYGNKTDLKNAKDNARTNAEWTLERYLKRNFVLKINGEETSLTFEGYECDAEATWCYLNVKTENACKKMELQNTLLYDYLPEQMNLVHFTLNGNKKSEKLKNPDKVLSVEW